MGDLNLFISDFQACDVNHYVVFKKCGLRTVLVHNLLQLLTLWPCASCLTVLCYDFRIYKNSNNRLIRALLGMFKQDVPNN